MSKLHVTAHPLIEHKLTLLRDKTTQPQEFRRILKEITFFLGYEATRGLTTKVHKVTTPNDIEVDGAKIAESVALIPICKCDNNSVTSPNQ